MTRVGWPERILLLSLTLVLLLFFRPVSDLFKQISADLDFEMDFEEILGIVAISTFLVGFSSVRLQSILEERKDGVARRIDRILEQNAGQDLLPLPTSLTQLKEHFEFDTDKASTFTILLTWLTFFISSLLIGVHQANSEVSSVPFWLVQGVHLGIVLIGTFSPYLVRQQFRQHLETQPFDCYEKMMEEIGKWLDEQLSVGKPSNSEEAKKTLDKVKNALEKFDDSVPEWCWLTLIRGSLFPVDKQGFIPQLERLRDHADLQRDADDYSLIAYVWSTYLVREDTASRLVKFRDLEKIIKFGSSTHSDELRTPSVFARLALMEVKKVWDARNVLNPNTISSYSRVDQFIKTK